MSTQVITHAGRFHADEVFACAMLQMLEPEITIRRVYAEEANTFLDDRYTVVLDMGRRWEPHLLNFDHHQGDPRDEEGYPLATAGMIWDARGSLLVRIYSKQYKSSLGQAAYEKLIEVATERVSEKLIRPLDAHDADGAYEVSASCSAGPLDVPTVPNLIASINGPDLANDGAQYGAFTTAVELAETVVYSYLMSAINYAAAMLKWDNSASEMMYGFLLRLNDFIPWQEAVHNSYPNVMLVAYPSPRPEAPWALEVVPSEPGKRDFRRGVDGLQRPPGFNGFIHETRWIAGCATWEELLYVAEYNLMMWDLVKEGGDHD